MVQMSRVMAGMVAGLLIAGGPFVTSALAQDTAPAAASPVPPSPNVVAAAVLTAANAADAGGAGPAGIQSAIQGAIAASGATPEIAVAALGIALATPGLSPAVIAALNAVLAQIQAGIGATNGQNPGVDAGDPPPADVGGLAGPDYRTQ